MSNPVHPSFTFRVNLGLLSNESFGAVTNSSSVGVLHPDSYQSDQDNAQVEKVNRKFLSATWCPGKQVGSNRVWTHGDEFTLTGLDALYIRDMYAVGYAPADRAVLDII